MSKENGGQHDGGAAAVLDEVSDAPLYPIGDDYQWPTSQNHLSTPASSVACDPVFLRVPPQIGTALRLLIESSRYARETGKDVWQFSVEWPELRRLGLSSNDGRWLINHKLVRQAREVTTVSDDYRQFVECPNLSLTAKTCFTLTPKGERLAFELILNVADPPSVRPNDAGRPLQTIPASSAAAHPLKPTWDRDRRQLRVGTTIVKEFKVPATNQEIVLAVFEEEDWPPKIDDPLPRKPEIDPQRRLHDTINSLNRRQRHHLLHFGADGLARGIRWELILPS